MVDFNGENIVTQPIKNILIFILVENYNNVVEAIELYKKQEAGGTIPVSLPALKSRIYTLYLRCRSALLLEPTQKNNSIIKLFDGLNDKSNFKDYLDGFLLLDEYLFIKGVTQFLTKRLYDSSKPEDEDEAHGL